MSVAALAAAMLAVFASACTTLAVDDLCIRLPNRESYRLRSANDMAKLATDLDELIRTEEQFLAQRNEEQKSRRTATPLEEMSPAQLKSYFAEPLDAPTSNELRGLRQLQALCFELKTSADPTARTDTLRLMAETARSLENLHRSPVPTRVEVMFMPVYLIEYLHHPVARGTTLAANIRVLSRDADPSRIDPPDSSFWKRPTTIASADLFHGFSRREVPVVTNLLWEYSEPKTSFGVNPGFEVKHGDLRLKVKFGELHSEPFTARVFHALGYNAEQTDFAPFIRVKYSRRLFREFNLRKEMSVKFRVLGVIPGGRVQVQQYQDPFQSIAAAMLRDGRLLTGEEFKQHLLLNPKREQPENDPANFDQNFEGAVDYLITRAANVQIRPSGVQNLGAWEFGGLGHEQLRELRGMALLAAWLGWVDTRFDNTRLKLVTSGDDVELSHYVSDLGGGLGKSVGYFSWQSEEANLFEWEFTTPRRQQGKGRMTIPFRIINYRPMARVPAFKEMTFDDARWMGRLMGQLTEKQIIEGLIVSGYDSVEVRLLTEKLISRRDRMIVDLELPHEIPLLRPNGPRRNLSYDPAVNGPVSILLPDGQNISAPVTDRKILRHGQITMPLEISGCF